MPAAVSRRVNLLHPELQIQLPTCCVLASHVPASVHSILGVLTLVNKNGSFYGGMQPWLLLTCVDTL